MDTDGFWTEGAAPDPMALSSERGVQRGRVHLSRDLMVCDSDLALRLCDTAKPSPAATGVKRGDRPKAPGTK